MDGVHDMGGMDGFGKVEPEPDEPVFHHRWEGRVLAMSRAIGVFRAWTIDTSRYAIELMAPSIYLTRPYYEKWFLRNQQLLIERGLIDSDEVAAGRALRPAKNMKRGPFTLADVEKVTRRGSYGRPGASPDRPPKRSRDRSDLSSCPSATRWRPRGTNTPGTAISMWRSTSTTLGQGLRSTSTSSSGKGHTAIPFRRSAPGVKAGQ